MEAVRAGDDHAFERLYHRYHRRISAYIFGMVHDHGRAEDLTQEVFVSALRRIRQTDRDIAFKPWIYEIAKNACIDAFRRSRRSEEVSIDAEGGLTPGDHGKLHATGPSPEAAVEGKQDLAHLTGAFGGLSDAHHEILVMRELEGLSYREIGKRLGMSRPSVESTLFRARRRLTEEYEELRTGERCLRIQEIIGRGAEAGGRLGLRDQRRLSSHVTHCQPCRRHAVMAGLDAAAVARRPVRSKLAGLLPLPAFLRRRWLDGGDAVAHHGAAVSKASLAAAQYGDSTMAGWMKAATVATAVAVAGVGAGAAGHVGRGGGSAAAKDGGGGAKVARAASVGGAVGSTRRTISASALRSSSRHVTVARRVGGRATTSHMSAAGGSAGGAGSGATTGGGGTFSGSGGSSGGGSGSGSGGSGGSGSGSGSGRDTASSASNSNSGSSSSTTKQPAASTGSGATDPVTSAANQAASTVSGATGQATGGGSTPPPLVDPNLGALTQPSSAPPPTTAGGVVSSATNTVGNTVGGTAGQAVKDTGDQLGDTVDDVTNTVTGAVNGLLGGGKGQ
ncbi:MAG TPA: sigma-70 family RNA polymerase sigma factor [Baekduia sp.]